MGISWRVEKMCNNLYIEIHYFRSAPLLVALFRAGGCLLSYRILGEMGEQHSRMLPLAYRSTLYSIHGTKVRGFNFVAYLV